MKKESLFLILLILSISLFGCSTYKIERGMKYFGHVPSLNIGIQTNITEYDINNVELDIYYGWEKDYFETLEEYEYVGVVILAHDSVLADSIFDYEFENYNNLENIDIEVYNITTESYYNANYHIVKEITEDLNNDKYIVELSKTGKALYKTHEKLLIPSDVFANPKVGFNMSILAVAKNIKTGKYRYLYTDSISFDFQILDNGNINLIEY